jgi:hypothetical protein
MPGIAAVLEVLHSDERTTARAEHGPIEVEIVWSDHDAHP